MQQKINSQKDVTLQALTRVYEFILSWPVDNDELQPEDCIGEDEIQAEEGFEKIKDDHLQPPDSDEDSKKPP